MRKWWHREVEGLTQGHTAGKWENWDRTHQSGSGSVLWATRWTATAVERHGHAGVSSGWGLEEAAWRSRREQGPREAMGPSRLHKGCDLTHLPLRTGRVGLKLRLRGAHCQAGPGGSD